MPAVLLSRLKIQIANLAETFPRPQEFQRGMRDILEFYADRVYHPGQVVQTSNRVLSYHVNKVVMNQIQIDLIRLSGEYPGAVVLNADLLWDDPFLEMRQIAAFLLGHAPLDPPEDILEHVRLWSQGAEDRPSITAVLNQGSQRLRRDYPKYLLELFNNWLTTKKTFQQSLGLQGLLSLINDREYENFPPIYEILGPWIQSPPIQLQTDLVEVIEALANRNSTETAYFLRQLISTQPRPSAARLIRRALAAFDPDSQAKLRSSLSDIAIR